MRKTSRRYPEFATVGHIEILDIRQQWTAAQQWKWTTIDCNTRKQRSLRADGMRKLSEIENDNIIHFVMILELETKVKRRFMKVSIVSYSRPSLMIIASASQFHV